MCVYVWALDMYIVLMHAFTALWFFHWQQRPQDESEIAKNLGPTKWENYRNNLLRGKCSMTICKKILKIYRQCPTVRPFVLLGRINFFIAMFVYQSVNGTFLSRGDLSNWSRSKMSQMTIILQWTTKLIGDLSFSYNPFVLCVCVCLGAWYVYSLDACLHGFVILSLTTETTRWVWDCQKFRTYKVGKLQKQSVV